MSNVRDGLWRLALVLGVGSLVPTYASTLFAAVKADGAVTWCMYGAATLFTCGAALVIGERLHAIVRWVIDGFKGR